MTIDVEEIQSNNSALVANFSVYPGPALLDPLTHNLKDDLSLLTSVVTASKRTWPKGTLPDVFRFRSPWPARSRIGPSTNIIRGPSSPNSRSGHGSTQVPATVTMVDRLLGWDIEVNRTSDTDPVGPYRVDLTRSLSTVGFGVVLLGVLIALASFGLFVAVQTSRDKRKFQPPMTTWYAAMLFAVMPLRNALPDAPPFGGWIDITIVLWVIVVLVISMGLYISAGGGI